MWGTGGGPPAIPSRDYERGHSGIALRHEVQVQKPMRFAGALIFGMMSSAAAQSDSSSVVRTIEIRRMGVFDSAEASNWIFRLVNRLHTGTRESVIRSELLFHEGEPFDSAATAESVRILRSLALFRDVEVTTFRTGTGVVERLTTRDAWSTSIGFDIQSTGNQAFYTAQLAETNFLGTGSRLLASYGTHPEYSAVDLEFSHPRLISHQIGIDVSYQQRSDGHQAILVVDRPFRALASTFGFSLTVREFDGQVRQFFEGRTAPRDTLQNRTEQVLLQASKAIRANADGYIRIGLIAQILRNDYQPVASAAPFPQHVIFTPGVLLAISRAHYEIADNYQHLHQTEDIDLSTTVSVGALVATRVGGSVHSGIGPFMTFRAGREIPDGFGIVAGQASGLFSSAGLDSGSAVIAATGVFRLGSDRERLLLHVEGGIARNMAPVDQFDLGAAIGPRGFGAHAFTGDRSFFSTAEYRYTLASDVGGLAGIGLAGFADYGGAWFAGSAPRAGLDAGIGLRIGSTRQADLRPIRIDLVRRFANDAVGAGWAVAVGKGFPFTLAQ